MKFIELFFVALLLVSLTLMGCNNMPFGGTPPEVPDANMSVAKGAKLTFQNLSLVKVKLPKSLAANTTTSRSVSRALARAEGDTVDINQVPSLKSQA